MGALVLISPDLPPARGGLADYTAALWSRLGRPACRFVVARGATESARHLGVEVAPWPSGSEREATAWLEGLGATTIAVQYVGYGFARDGAPEAFTRALAAWRGRHGGRLLVAFCHEIWASGPPWTRAFWTHRAQRRATTTLARAADTTFVTSLAASQLLTAATQGAVVPTLQPIPSNIDVVVPRGRREGGLHVALFGLPNTRRAALLTFRRTLAELGRRGVLARVSLVGGAPPPRAGDAEVQLVRLCAGRTEVERLYDADAAEVSRVLACTDLALSPTPAHLVTKSGAGMAALAHGVALAVAPSRSPCPLHVGAQLIVPDEDGGTPLERHALDAVGEAGQRWYLEHAAWPVQLRRWSRALEL